MSCIFFENKPSTFGWNPHCLKKREKIPSDVYDRYCKGYNYSNCPIYKSGDSSGGCYLTSACVFAKNLPEDGTIDIYDPNLTTTTLKHRLLIPFERCRYCGSYKKIPWTKIKNPSTLDDWIRE